MKRLFCSFVAAFILVSGPALAGGEIDLDGAVLSWQSGAISPDDYNGAANGVTITFDDGGMATADRLVIRTDETADRLTLNEFELINFIMEEQGTTSAFSQLRWTGAVYNGSLGELLGQIGDETLFESVEEYGRLQATGISLNLDDGSGMTVERLLIDSEAVSVDALKTLPLHAGILSIEALVFLPPADSKGYEEYKELLNKINQKNISFNIKLQATVDERADRVDSTTALAVAADGLGSMDLSLDMGMLNATLQMIHSMTGANANDDDQLMAMLMTGLFFNDARLNIRDFGMLPLVLDYYADANGRSRAGQINQIMGQLAFNVGTLAPQTYAQIDPPMRSFLETGGAIELTMRPSSPVPVSSFLGFAAVPDTAFAILGADLQRLP